MELERTDDALVLQNCVCDPDESAEEDRGPLLAAPASAESATLRERIKVSTKKNLTYIRENRRKLAAGVMLWTAFLIATIAFSLLAPFFPQEVIIMLCFVVVFCCFLLLMFCCCCFWSWGGGGGGGGRGLG